MNEITRIHIAKTPYDIEVVAKKQLEKYIKSLEVYTQDADVLADIEIRITELLAEQGVAAGGVIGSDDVAAVRKQLGEPHEFGDADGDIAVGPERLTGGRRLYRSTDDAVLGGVLSGIASYFGVNPLWTRLVFVLLLFVSFGLASLVYILFWILMPPARTATEKLQLAGKDVTVESIKALSAEEETARPNKVAPVLRQIFALGIGTLSLIGAVSVFAFTVWLVVAASVADTAFVDATNGFMGLGDGNSWIVWLVFTIVILGLLLLAALFGLIAYGFFAKKLTKRMVVSGSIIVVLGIVSVAGVLGISATQSFRVASETRSMVRETKTNLPKEFANVTSVNFTVSKEKIKDSELYFSAYPSVQYVVDEGPARYEFTALPTSKAIVTTDGTTATISISVQESFRNSFVRPTLVVYGPALNTINGEGTQVEYTGVTQDSLAVHAKSSANISVSGSFNTVEVQGSGSVDLGSSAIQSLLVTSSRDLSVRAGTVKSLTVSQPGVCPSGTYSQNTHVRVEGVTSNEISYNGTMIPAVSQQTNCAAITVKSDEASGY